MHATRHLTLACNEEHPPHTHACCCLQANAACTHGHAFTPTRSLPARAPGVAATYAFRERLYDVTTGLLRPNNFSDLSEALVSQALPAALALVRDAHG